MVFFIKLHGAVCTVDLSPLLRHVEKFELYILSKFAFCSTSHFFQILVLHPKAWTDITNQISIYLLTRFPKVMSCELASFRLRNISNPFLFPVLILEKRNGDGGLETMKKD